MENFDASILWHTEMPSASRFKVPLSTNSNAYESNHSCPSSPLLLPCSEDKNHDQLASYRAQRHRQPYYSTSRQTPLPHSIRKAASGLHGCPRKQSCSGSVLASNHGSASKKKTAVIIVDHGSRRPESNQQLEQFVQLYRSCFASHNRDNSTQDQTLYHCGTQN